MKSLIGIGYGASLGTDEGALGISILKADAWDLEVATAHLTGARTYLCNLGLGSPLDLPMHWPRASENFY